MKVFTVARYMKAFIYRGMYIWPRDEGKEQKLLWNHSLAAPSIAQAQVVRTSSLVKLASVKAVSLGNKTWSLLCLGWKVGSVHTNLRVHN